MLLPLKHASDSNMPSSRLETTPRKRASVITLFNTVTQSRRKISQLTGIPKSTVIDIITRARVRHEQGLNPTGNYLRTGRPKIYSEEEKQELLQLVNRDPFAIISELKRDLNSQNPLATASRQTISHILGAEQIGSRVAKKKPFLKDQHKMARLQWCLERQYWTLEEWSRVIWTDESTFELGALAGGRRRCWRQRGVAKAYESRYLKPTFKSGRSSVMMWGSIIYGFKGPMTILDAGRMNGSKYISMVLMPHLIPFWMEMSEHYGIVEVMEDGARVHTAKMCCTYREAHGLVSMPWPAQSPDLNPIENLWSIMKYEISKLAKPKSIDEMALLLAEQWNQLTPKVWKNLIESMPRRVKACIEAEGGSIRY